ncbi:MAG: hypothetical protein A2Y04_04300 [Omnitrophica WOR_2 bacterium GWC2_45_7]|nr:MAG: hypothetical protein A2Y04_04300 [Omnitrophica WOR_2 bacterium GWC2_45_7]
MHLPSPFKIWPYSDMTFSFCQEMGTLKHRLFKHLVLARRSFARLIQTKSPDTIFLSACWEHFAIFAKIPLSFSQTFLMKKRKRTKPYEKA